MSGSDSDTSEYYKRGPIPGHKWNEFTLEDLNITSRRVDATTFFGAPSNELPIPELPYSLLEGSYAPKWTGSKSERQFYNLCYDAQGDSYRCGDILVHTLSMLDYDTGYFRFHRNCTFELDMGGDGVDCKMDAGLMNNEEPWPCLVVLEFAGHRQLIDGDLGRVVSSAFAVACQEKDTTDLNTGFDITIPVIAIRHCKVLLYKVPVNLRILRVVEEYGEHPLPGPSMVVEEFHAGTISWNAEGSKEVFRHLEAFKRFVLDLDRVFADHRGFPVREEVETMPKLDSKTPCTVDTDSLGTT